MPGRSSQDNDSGGVFSSDEEPQRTKDKEREKAEKDRHGAKRFSLHRKKDRTSQVIRGQLPARLIRTTKVKPNTLNPVWKERFRL